MKYGIVWYTGIGEHDYTESGRSEHDSMRSLFTGLMAQVNDMLLFGALEDGRQDTIYWVTDDFGFAFYRP